ncbi:MAG: M20/M25/M40 family metallo-hydrolase, partial [Usitatibacter sp.]
MLDTRIARKWDDEIVPQLIEYIRLPAKSPHFDPEWRKHGHIEAAIKQAHTWAAAQDIKGLKLEIVRLEGRTPVLLFDVPATNTSQQTVVFYGHLDKQPEMTGWRSDMGPWSPLLEQGRLYGRGGADDGYAIFAALTAVMALDAEGIGRPRCVGLIETCEESGSPDLPAYL